LRNCEITFVIDYLYDEWNNKNHSILRPSECSRTALDTMIDQIVAWSTALAPLRSRRDSAA